MLHSWEFSEDSFDLLEAPERHSLNVSDKDWALISSGKLWMQAQGPEMRDLGANHKKKRKKFQPTEVRI